MGDVLPLNRPRTVDEAWESYVALAKRIPEDTSLLSQRPFVEQLARAHREWLKLFMAQEADA